MGQKHDMGKPRLGLVLGDFANALQAVGAVGTFGAGKYADSGWLTLENGQQRYTDAMLRHFLQEAAGEESDGESGLLHAAHAAWNALARLELRLRERGAQCEWRPDHSDAQMVQKAANAEEEKATFEARKRAILGNRRKSRG